MNIILAKDKNNNIKRYKRDMSGWEAYIYQLQNRYDATTGQYTLTNVCEHAGIFGTDGTPWALSGDFKLSTYDYDLS